jgi:single-strand selective monofunctional uracil DNA glycosylase
MANAIESSDSVSHRLLSIELLQCVKLNALLFCAPVEYIYNPLEYAYDVHSNFVHKFCTSTKKILFLGMNPGPWGMSQTGVRYSCRN